MESGHYSMCHYSDDDAFVAANAPETSRSRKDAVKGDVE